MQIRDLSREKVAITFQLRFKAMFTWMSASGLILASSLGLQKKRLPHKIFCNEKEFKQKTKKQKCISQVETWFEQEEKSLRFYNWISKRRSLKNTPGDLLLTSFLDS